MTRPKILGYIVMAHGVAYCVGCYEAGRPVLVHGRHVDVFPTRRVARLMVKRTVAYAIAHRHARRGRPRMSPRARAGARGKEPKEWVVPLTYELRGSVVIEAETAEEAIDKAVGELQYQPTFELINYEIGTPRPA